VSFGSEGPEGHFGSLDGPDGSGGAGAGGLNTASITTLQALATLTPTPLKAGQQVFVISSGLTYTLESATGVVVDQTFVFPTVDDPTRAWFVTGFRTPGVMSAKFKTCMPLGDSTTQGTGDNIPSAAVTPYWPGLANDQTGGYRWHLLQFLRTFGVLSPEATGPGWYRGSYAATCTNLPSSSREHQGLAGEDLATMNSTFAAVWAGSGPTDLIILSGGINDIGLDGLTPAQTAARLATLLATIKATSGNTPTIFWTPAPPILYYAQLAAFAPLAEAVVIAAQNAGQKVCTARVAAYVSANTEVNNVHPNSYGYRDIAGVITPVVQAFPF
jgi:hypothetical protein